MASPGELLGALKRYWGHDAFRPLQERIVRSLLDGRDVCVIMPTGGGKSLCYQLPAALLEGQTVLVVSPLMALMSDQVAQLAQMGIPAAFLNSSLAPRRQAEIIQRARRGEFRLLYVSPERLARADTHSWLQHVPLAFFAIDEAHCISQWGHEFRPEYRQLSGLRRRFPHKPIAAFTASATRHVRHDIIEQLQLRSPEKFIASFHRSNLRYVVRETSAARRQDLLLRALRHYQGESVIVYAPTIARVEETAAFLQDSGFRATAYHGKMNAAARTRSHESWMSGDADILVGTVAFGMGINKSAVRAVIHLSLPQSIEQFYQEAGRAGRDGAPADCVMLWQKRDAGLLAHFAGQIADPVEQNRAWDRYREIRAFVEDRVCRHLRLCAHFGESKKWASCSACDVCGYLPAWWPAEEESPRPARAKSKSARRSASSRAVPRSRPEDHLEDTLDDLPKVFHITRTAPSGPPRPIEELPQRQSPLPSGTWWGSAKRNPQPQAPAAGAPKPHDAAAARQSPPAPRSSRAAELPGADRDALSQGLRHELRQELRHELREWRRAAAKQQSIPAFIILHDTTLDALCSLLPASPGDLLNVPGIGEAKAARYGAQILEIIHRFRATSASPSPKAAAHSA